MGSSGGTPVYVRDVADVSVGRELRTGSASENGEEVVLGTALMLIGGNSRAVAADVGDRLEQVAATLPPGVVARPVLDRTGLVDKAIATVEKNLLEGALLVIVVLFALLGNFRAAFITALAIPLAMLLTATGMVRAGISGNLLSLGAIDFGIIVDGSVIIVENCLRRLAERQHELKRTLTLPERLREVRGAATEMVRPSVFGQAIIITVYLPILALTGTEGKMFTPMATTVIFALIAALVLSLTFVPAMVAIFISGKVSEKENFLVRGVKAAYEPLLRLAVRGRWVVTAAAVVIFAGAAWLFTTLGQEFIPQLDEGDVALQALRMPSTGLTQSQEIQFDLERRIGAIPEVRYVFSKTGTAEVAADPMPPNISDTFIMLKEPGEWRPTEEILAEVEKLEPVVAGLAGEAHDDEHEERAGGNFSAEKNALMRLIELTAATVPGSNYEFTQPIAMRFNELISGVRSDVAVKVFGDEFDVMLPAAHAIAAVLGQVPGAADVKVEQTEGLPMLDVEIDRAAIGRLGLHLRDVQQVVAAAVGGQEAGMIFEGDRRFDIIVRLPENLRGDLDGLADLPIPLPRPEGEAQYASMGTNVAPSAPPFVPLGDVATIGVREGLNQVSRENGKRRVVVQANVRGRDIGSFVNEAKEKIAAQAAPPPGTYLDWGGQFENLARARARLLVVVPICFLLIFGLLFMAFNSLKYAAMVFTCVPLALTGGIVALWLRDMPFSISAGVGFIALSGVAVLNGLVMVTFINQLRAEGASVADAVQRGSMTRLRPVLMTATVAPWASSRWPWRPARGRRCRSRWRRW